MKTIKDMIFQLDAWRKDAMDDIDNWENDGDFYSRRFILSPFGEMAMWSHTSPAECGLTEGDICGDLWWKYIPDYVLGLNTVIPMSYPWCINYERILVYYLPEEDPDKAVLIGNGELHRYEDNQFLMQYGFQNHHVPVTVREDRPCFALVARYDLSEWDLTMNEDKISGTAKHERFPNYSLTFRWDKEHEVFDFSLIRTYKRHPDHPTVRSWINQSFTASLQGVTHDIPCYLDVDDQNEV